MTQANTANLAGVFPKALEAVFRSRNAERPIVRSRRAS